MKKTFLGIFVLLATAYSLHATAILADTPLQGMRKTLEEQCCLLEPPDCKTVAKEAECRQQALFQSGGYATDKPTATIPGRVGVLITVITSVTGIAFTAIVVFSGIQWMMAGEKEEVVKKAKTRITRATIGLLIVFASWAVVNFVLRGLTTPTGQDNLIQIRTLP